MRETSSAETKTKKPAQAGQGSSGRRGHELESWGVRRNQPRKEWRAGHLQEREQPSQSPKVGGRSLGVQERPVQGHSGKKCRLAGGG